MKYGKILLMALMLTAPLFLATFSVMPVSAKIVPTPEEWNSFNPVTFTETAGVDRVNEPMDVFFYPSFGNCSSPDEIRVIAPDNETEVPSQVYNVTMESGYVKSCNVVFPVNCTAYNSVTYYIVYNNPGVSAPSYPTDLKVTTRVGEPIIEIEATVNNSEYRAYVGREASIGGTETGKEVFIWDYSSTQKLFDNTGCMWLPWAREGNNYYWWQHYKGKSTLGKTGPVFVDIEGAAIWNTNPSGLINTTSKLRFYAYNEWFITTYSYYNTGGKTYAWLKPNIATDNVYVKIVSFPNKTSGTIESYDVNQPPLGAGRDFFTTDWDGTWMDFQNTTGADNTHGFAVLQLPGDFPLARVKVTNATPFVGLMRSQWGSGPDECSMFWNGSGEVFTANLAVGFHAWSNYTYAQDLYNRLNNSLQSTLEVLTEDGSPAPSFALPSGWSTYTPVNVTETIGISRTFEPVDVFFRPGAGTCQSIDEIRVYTSNGVEIPSQVYNETTGVAGVESLNVVFLANVTANTEDTYYIIYNNPGAPAPSYTTDLSVTYKVLRTIPSYYTQDIENSYYNFTGGMEGALKEVKILGYNSTTTAMGGIFLPVIRFSGETKDEEGWFGFWSYRGSTTLVRKGPVFADVEGIITNWGQAQGRTSGMYNCTMNLRFYAYTPWVTATITFNGNGSLNYELTAITAHANTMIMPWLTRPNAVGVVETFNMTLRPGNVTRTPKNLTWCADWQKTWLDFANSTAANNPVGCSLAVMPGTTPLVGLRSEDGDEGSPYWNGTCTTKTANLAVAFHTNSNYTYAEEFYEKMSNPLTVTVGSEVSLWTEFSLIDLYNITLNFRQGLDAGDRLIVKFYSYDGTYQAQSAPIWTGTTPAIATLSKNLTHPNGWPMENVTIILYDGATAISTVASFAVHRSHLMSRLGELDYLWTVPGADRTAIMKEYVAIDGQWPYAPP